MQMKIIIVALYLGLLTIWAIGFIAAINAILLLQGLADTRIMVLGLFESLLTMLLLGALTSRVSD